MKSNKYDLFAALLLLLPLTVQGQVLTNEAGNTLHLQAGSVIFVDGDLNNLGTVSGDGTVQAANLAGNPGTVAPGQSPGQLKVTGNLDMNGTTYPCEINGTAAGISYDELIVTGAATLTGGVVNITWGFTPLVTDEFTILSFGSRTGTPTINIPMVGGLTFVAVISNNNIILREASLLPVELVSFTAVEQRGAVLLEWQTASEENNKGFEVLRLVQSSGKDWQGIGFVAGQGNSNTTKDYVFMDERPVPGTNYYRLRQLDFDGQIEYSKTVSVNIGHDEISVFPNPVNGVLTVMGITREDTRFELYDKVGRVVLENALGDTHEIDLTALPNGIYTLNILSGNKIIARRIIKQ